MKRGSLLMELEESEAKRPRIDRLPELANRVFGNSLVFTRITANFIATRRWRDMQNVDLINHHLNRMASNYLWPSISRLWIASGVQFINGVRRENCFDNQRLEMMVFVQGRRLSHFSSLPDVTAAILRKCLNIEELRILYNKNGLPVIFERRLNEIVHLTIAEIVKAIEKNGLALRILQIGGEPFLTAAKPLLQAVSWSIEQLKLGRDDTRVINDVGICALKQSPHLKSVNIEYWICEEDFRHIFEIESVKHLYLNRQPKEFTSEKLTQIYHESGILLRLKTLHFNISNANNFLRHLPVSNSIDHFEAYASVRNATTLLRLAVEKLPNLRNLTINIYNGLCLAAEAAPLLVDLVGVALFEFQATPQHTINLTVRARLEERLMQQIMTLVAALVDKRKDIVMQVADNGLPCSFQRAVNRKQSDTAAHFKQHIADTVYILI